MIDLHMDARAMEFEDGSFDGAIDKGTFDSILVILIIYLSVGSHHHPMLKKWFMKFTEC